MQRRGLMEPQRSSSTVMIGRLFSAPTARVQQGNAAASSQQLPPVKFDGTAKGLAYLYHKCLEWVIHCDVKPEDIVLDSEFQPKIADFRLATLSRRDSHGSEITRIRGTKGYMAPEWALNQPITAKVDVYGLWIWTVKKKSQRGNSSWVESIVDSRLEGNYSRKQAATPIQLGLLV
ncbi:unnamed protein product [Fraxinus pennsylvanica]|uniref:Protein kinase domain-containing protein n=1 Tax=Fraxinus pennsylvanica TaxID=56036 RepID=A0AAD2DK92_9LAMI|nr:unnamed protein product [Fraxinus pennsylvanica]